MIVHSFIALSTCLNFQCLRISGRGAELIFFVSEVHPAIRPEHFIADTFSSWPKPWDWPL